MGKLDERAFAATIAACKVCDAKAFEVSSYIDRQVTVMLGERNDDGRWVHDGEKFIDGVYRVRCIRCGNLAFSSQDCPRCHREAALPRVLGMPSNLAVPKRCPSCKGTEMTITGFAPGVVRTGEGRPPSPTPAASFGEQGFHVAHVMCDGCDWVAVAEGCPLCAGQGPLRPRPS